MAEHVARIVPGAHLAVVWEHGLALLDGSLPSEDVVAMWENLHDVADLTQFFARLAAGTGLGLLELPPFGVAIHVEPGATQLAARGGFVVDVGACDAFPEPQRVSGESVTTWVERRVDAAGGLVIRSLDQQEGGPGSDIAWPLVSGVGPATSVSHGVVSATRSAPDVKAAAVASESDSRAPTGEEAAADAFSEAADVPADGVEVDPVAPDPGLELTPPTETAPDPERGPPPDAQPQGLFSHLWSDHTIITPPEEAAVRPLEPDDHGPESGSDVHHVVDIESHESAQEARRRTAEETWVEPSSAPAVEVDVDVDAADQPGTESPQDGDSPASPGVPRFISWVPSAARAPVTTEIEQAAPTKVEPSTRQTEEHPDPGAKLGDHDGHTVMSVPEPQQGSPKFVVNSRQVADDPDLIVGVLCPSGHGNPPQRSVCRICHAGIAGNPVRMPRPALGRLSSSTGESFDLTGPVVVGRNPRASRFQGTDIPRLVAIPQAHVSASHLEIRLEGWSVVAVDLKSTNGTFLRRHSDPPMRLPETPQLLVSDDVLDLGHGVHLSFTALP